MKRSRKLICLAALSLVAFAASVPAVSATPATEGYDESGVVGQLDEQSGNGPTAPAAVVKNAPAASAPAETAPVASAPAESAPVEAASTGGSLPFTGLDLAIVALLGGALVGTGLVLRRTIRPGDAA